MVRTSVLIVFIASLCFAAWLGFSSVQVGHDKLVHFTTFFILTAEFYFLWEIHRPWKITLLVMTLGASIMSEYAQNFINPRRLFDYMDIVYNIHGSGLALILCCLAQAYYGRRRPVPTLGPDPEEEYVDVGMETLSKD